MNIPTNKIDVSEWEIDKYGRRFRRIGQGCIEYEPTITINGIEIPQSQLKEYHQSLREAEKKQKEAEKVRTEPTKAKNCPFSNGMQPTCTRDKCALFVDGCAIPKIINAPARKNTEGLQCPFNQRRVCISDCALYQKGCILTAITASLTEREV